MSGQITFHTRKITRRSRFMACVRYTPGEITIEDCVPMTPKQFIEAYQELREQNVNASVFRAIFHKGQKMIVNIDSVRDLVNGLYDDIDMEYDAE